MKTIINYFWGRCVILSQKQICYLLLIALLVCDACKHEVKTVMPDSFSPGLFTINFEVEHLLLPGSRNADNVPSYEQILSMPFADKNKISITVYNDGASA